MQHDPAALTHRWFHEVWNLGMETTIDEMVTADSIGHGLGEGGADVRGADAFKAFWRNLRGALPDIHIRIEDTIVDHDKCVVRVVLEGTHTGEGLGMAPSGRRVSTTGVVISQIRDGRFVESWNSWDQLGLLQQIGAFPSPPAEDRFLAAKT